MSVYLSFCPTVYAFVCNVQTKFLGNHKSQRLQVERYLSVLNNVPQYFFKWVDKK